MSSPRNPGLLVDCLALLVAAVLQPRASAAPPGGAGKAVRTDRYGDPLPDGAIARFGTTRLRLGSDVWGVHFSQDGKLLAARSNLDHFALFEADTGRLVRHSRDVTGYSLSGDGKVLALCIRDAAIVIQETKTGRELRRVEVKKRVNRGEIALSSDGTVLAWAGEDEAIHLLDRVRGRELRRLPAPSDSFRFLAFTTGGQRLVAGWEDGPSSEVKVRLWEVATGKELLRLSLPSVELSAPALPADGKYLAYALSPRSVRLWSLETGKEVRRFGDSALSAVASSPDGKVLAAAGEEVVRLWQTGTGRELSRFRYPPLSVHAMAFSPDGKVLALGGSDHQVRLFEAATGKELHQGRGPVGRQCIVALSPDGAVLATTGWKTCIRLWDTSTSKELRRLASHPSGVATLTYFPSGGRLLSVGFDGSLCVWNASTGERLQAMPASKEENIESVVFLSDRSALAAGATENTVWVKDVMTGKSLYRLPNLQLSAGAVALSPDGRTLAAHDGGDFLCIWYLPRGGVPHRIKARLLRSQDFVLCCLAFSQDGKTLACNDANHGMRLIEVATGRERCRLRGDSSGMASVAFSPDGRLLASGDDGGFVSLWNTATGTEQARVEGHRGLVARLAFSSNGKLLVSTSNDTTTLAWDVCRLMRAGKVRHRREE